MTMLYVQANHLMLNDKIAYQDKIYRVYDLKRHHDYVTIGLSDRKFLHRRCKEIKAMNSIVFAVHH